MSLKQILSPYIASFRLGARLALSQKADFLTMLITYSVLLLIFASVYAIMPIHELQQPDITQYNMLWYFAMTEVVIIGIQGNQREFGRQIADGQLTTLMQRPGNLSALLIARLMGNCVVKASVLFCYASVMIPLLTGSTFPLPLLYSPLFLLSVMLGLLTYILMGHMIGMLEIFGPYSQPSSMIVSKFVFTFGGLFFPVMLFPPLLQKIVWLTPFPAVITTAGSFMLHPSTTQIIHHLVHQWVWIGLLIGLLVWLEKRLIQRVLVTGD